MIKLKLEEEYSHLKLIFFLCVLLTLLILILFSVSNRFVCYFRLLKFTVRKNRLDTVYASDSIQQREITH